MITERLAAMFAIYDRVRVEGKFNMLSAEAALRMRELQTSSHAAQYGEITGEAIREVVEHFDELVAVRNAIGNVTSHKKRKRNPSALARAFVPLRRRKFFCRQSFSGDHDGNHLYMSPTSHDNWEKNKKARVHFKGDWDVAKNALQNVGINLTKKHGIVYITKT